jgi:hypothetical protein
MCVSHRLDEGRICVPPGAVAGIPRSAARLAKRLAEVTLSGAERPIDTQIWPQPACCAAPVLPVRSNASRISIILSGRFTSFLPDATINMA